MDFSLTQEQQLIKETIGKFVNEELRPGAAAFDRKTDPKECIPWAMVEKALSLGIGSAGVPKELGGGGLSYVDTMILAEELARGDAGFTATLLSNVHASRTILHFGSEPQKKNWLKEIIENSSKRFLMGFAFTEPQSGCDVMSPDPNSGIRTSVRREGQYYVLNGRKNFITNGGIAGAYLVWARTDEKKGAPQGGLSAFYVPADTPGFKVGRIEDKLGQRLSQQAELIFDDCKIPSENLIGQEGMGFRICVDLMASTLTSVGAIGVGIAQAAFELAYSYAKDRVQGGTQIINHQAISHKLANMFTMIEATRNTVYKSAWLQDQGRPEHLLASICKVLGSELAISATNDALQIFGGYGYTKEYPIEKLYRDARVLSIYEAGNEVHRASLINILLMLERAGQQQTQSAS